MGGSVARERRWSALPRLLQGANPEVWLYVPSRGDVCGLFLNYRLQQCLFFQEEKLHGSLVELMAVLTVSHLQSLLRAVLQSAECPCTNHMESLLRARKVEVSTPIASSADDIEAMASPATCRHNVTPRLHGPEKVSCVRKWTAPREARRRELEAFSNPALNASSSRLGRIE